MNVVFAGCTGAYGHSFSAVNSKTRLMCLGLIESGTRCSIYDGLLGYGSVEEAFVDDGIEVIIPQRKGSVFWGEIKNIPHFFKFLKERSTGSDKNVLVVELPLYHNYLAYVLCGKKLGYKIIVIAHEWSPTLIHNGLYSKVSSFLYTRTFGYFIDGAFPISEYIINKMEHFKKPYYKVPAIADFSVVPIEYSNRDSGFFVYCASANYSRVANLIIESYYEYRQNNGKFALKMILSGTEKAINDIKNVASKLSIDSFVSFYSKIPYEELLHYYRNAAALLIPLDPNYEQDTARFPQKIAEYCSMARPIITTDVGEVDFYFSDDNSIKAAFTKESLAEKMKWVEDNEENAAIIGENGYLLGLKEFEFRGCGKKMYNFLNSLFS